MTEGRKLRVAMLYGGFSAEREVSLSSGRECAAAARSLGHEVVAIDVTRDVAGLVAALTPRPDVVLNALHGRWGEDGCVQGLLNLLDIPYTHSGVLASALAMDKPTAKRVFEAAGLRCPGGEVLHRSLVEAGDPMPRPYVVKPIDEGSSVGVTIVQPGDNKPAIHDGAWPYGDAVLVEPYIPGRELTVAVMGDRALAVTELRPKQGFYSYEAKYTEGKTEHLVPAPVPQAIYDQAMDEAVAAHRALGCRGVSRADFRYDDRPGQGEAGGLYLLEVNTQPGMTPLSLVPEQAAHLGISFPELIGWMLEQAACD
ncbi:D-alanine-D-alanine ligase [Tistlia consotensis]|uniref:D-alanine--D-alanine ligase n=1 Tax=Tistlia consotensis USBA 355 TaxID=560819 RepID=A0A1Y6CQF9_9PROT|nr:D-alanine--D-alanine ligase [Tistlia consotensis]SMF71021.1 D-alanine-D-alanine ligase [Tistlia consotensis USBA 355]SNS06929.1 D-alanine-D-alanine ligase [Tistlia consotensis]